MARSAIYSNVLSSREPAMQILLSVSLLIH